MFRSNHVVYIQGTEAIREHCMIHNKHWLVMQEANNGHKHDNKKHYSDITVKL